ncbi:sulfotransferase domain-containing protein [Halosimplex halobium]|uniref:sulfotransferase domain-containing protein n=1 Tax=Halosimplex halobium TaxID=3396618 RepID=UPI003F548615
MTDSPLPDFVIVGPQKCATTWMYECLREHPEVLMPETDSVHYFDMNYHRGEEWYRGFFDAHDNEPIVGEETPSYIRDSKTPKRMGDLIPDARVIFSLRNPVERAYSHYWHERSKGKIDFAFEEVFENYDLFENWVVPGFYHQHLQRFKNSFPEDQLKVAIFDDLVTDDKVFIQDIFDFIGADDSFVPSFIDNRVNEARSEQPTLYRKLILSASTSFPDPVLNLLRPVHQRLESVVLGKDEYNKGIEPGTRQKLESIYAAETVKLESFINRDLDHWFEHIDLANYR